MEHVEHDSMSVHTCTQSTSLRDDSSAQAHMIVGTHIFEGPKGGGRSPRGESKSLNVVFDVFVYSICEI